MSQFKQCFFFNYHVFPYSPLNYSLKSLQLNVIVKVLKQRNLVERMLHRILHEKFLDYRHRFSSPCIHWNWSHQSFFYAPYYITGYSFISFCIVLFPWAFFSTQALDELQNGLIVGSPPPQISGFTFLLFSICSYLFGFFLHFSFISWQLQWWKIL